MKRTQETWSPGYTRRGGRKHGVLGTLKFTILLDDMLEGILILLIFARISQMI